MLPDEFGTAFVSFVKASGLFPEVSQYYPALEKHSQELYYDFSIGKLPNSARRYQIDISLRVIDESRSNVYSRLMEIVDYVTSNPIPKTNTLFVPSVFITGGAHVSGTASPYEGTANVRALAFWIASP